MGGDAEKTQTTSQQTNPWAPAMPGLKDLISKYTGQSTDVTGDQSNALGMLRNAISGMQDFSGAGNSAVSNLFGSNFNPQIGMLNSANTALNDNLSATASGANLDPYKTPGFSDAIQTAIQDTTNAVKGVYAGSGRDPSGAGSFAQSLGRGITQGISPTIAAQANQNIANMNDANKTLYNAAGSTATGTSGLQQQGLMNGINAIGAAGTVPNLATQQGTAALNLANTSYNQPYGNLSSLLGPLTQLGSMGQQSNGTTTQTQSNSLLSNILGGAMGTAGILGQTGAFGASGWMGPAMSSLFAFSDENVKEDIEKVGETYDGQNIYSYRYIGDDTPRMGLLAQEVERRDPSNVIEIGGIKAVNYDKALHGSRRIAGMLGGLE